MYQIWNGHPPNLINYKPDTITAWNDDHHASWPIRPKSVPCHAHVIEFNGNGVDTAHYDVNDINPSTNAWVLLNKGSTMKYGC